MKRRADIIRTDMPTLSIELGTGPEGVFAVYFRFTSEPVAKTIEADEPDVLVDVDARGKIVGLELTNPAHVSLKRLLNRLASRYKAKELERFGKTQSDRLVKLEELIAV